MTTIDYTKMRRNALVDNRYICICPKCGKKGLRSVYPAKGGKQESAYAHEGQRGLFGMIEIINSCFVTVEVTAS